MRNLFKFSLIGLGAVALLTTILGYLLWRGYFDRGQFEIKQFQWSSTGQVAMIAERSDHQALGGLDYFALIESHLLTPAELRHAYHSDAVVFSAQSTCLSVRWAGASSLLVRCSGSYVDQDDISVEKRQSGNVKISYENIATK